MRKIVRAVGVMAGVLCLTSLVLGARRTCTSGTNPRRIEGRYLADTGVISDDMEFNHLVTNTHFLGNDLVYEPGRFASPVGDFRWYGDEFSRLVVFTESRTEATGVDRIDSGRWAEFRGDPTQVRALDQRSWCPPGTPGNCGRDLDDWVAEYWGCSVGATREERTGGGFGTRPDTWLTDWTCRHPINDVEDQIFFMTGTLTTRFGGSGRPTRDAARLEHEGYLQILRSAGCFPRSGCSTDYRCSFPRFAQPIRADNNLITGPGFVEVPIPEYVVFVPPELGSPELEREPECVEAFRSVDIGYCSAHQAWTLPERGCGIADLIAAAVAEVPPLSRRGILWDSPELANLSGWIVTTQAIDVSVRAPARWRTQYTEAGTLGATAELCVQVPLHVDVGADVIVPPYTDAIVGFLLTSIFGLPIPVPLGAQRLGCRFGELTVDLCGTFGTAAAPGFAGQYDPRFTVTRVDVNRGPYASYDGRACVVFTEDVAMDLAVEPEIRNTLSTELAHGLNAALYSAMWQREMPRPVAELDQDSCDPSHGFLARSRCAGGSSQAVRDQACMDFLADPNGLDPRRLRARCEQRRAAPCRTDADCHPNIVVPPGSQGPSASRDLWGCVDRMWQPCSSPDGLGPDGYPCECGDLEPMCYWNVGLNRIEVTPTGAEFVFADNSTDDSALPVFASASICSATRQGPSDGTAGSMGWQLGAPPPNARVSRIAGGEEESRPDLPSEDGLSGTINTFDDVHDACYDDGIGHGDCDESSEENDPEYRSAASDRDERSDEDSADNDRDARSDEDNHLDDMDERSDEDDDFDD